MVVPKIKESGWQRTATLKKERLKKARFPGTADHDSGTKKLKRPGLRVQRTSTPE